MVREYYTKWSPEKDMEFKMEIQKIMRMSLASKWRKISTDADDILLYLKDFWFTGKALLTKARLNKLSRNNDDFNIFQKKYESAFHNFINNEKVRLIQILKWNNHQINYRINIPSLNSLNETTLLSEENFLIDTHNWNWFPIGKTRSFIQSVLLKNFSNITKSINNKKNTTEYRFTKILLLPIDKKTLSDNLDSNRNLSESFELITLSHLSSSVRLWIICVDQFAEIIIANKHFFSDELTLTALWLDRNISKILSENADKDTLVWILKNDIFKLSKAPTNKDLKWLHFIDSKNKEKSEIWSSFNDDINWHTFYKIENEWITNWIYYMIKKEFSKLIQNTLLEEKVNIVTAEEDWLNNIYSNIKLLKWVNNREIRTEYLPRNKL